MTCYGASPVSVNGTLKRGVAGAALTECLADEFRFICCDSISTH